MAQPTNSFSEAMRQQLSVPQFLNTLPQNTTKKPISESKDFALIPQNSMEIKSEDELASHSVSLPTNQLYHQHGLKVYRKTSFNNEKKASNSQSFENEKPLPPLRHTYRPR